MILEFILTFLGGVIVGMILAERVINYALNMKSKDK